jgi:hypothetical protein
MVPRRGRGQLRFELAPAQSGAHTDLRFTVTLAAADKAARDGVNDRWREHYEEYERRGFPATAPIPGSAA